jgi:autotransporter adhesin
MPGQSSFDTSGPTPVLPVNLQKLWIVNTDSNVVKQVSMVNYFGKIFPNAQPSLYSNQVDFTGSTRVAQDFVGDSVTIRDNNLVYAAALTTDPSDPLFNQSFYYDRVVKINVNTGVLEEDYIVARSAAALQVALDMGYDAVLADGAGEIIPGFTEFSLKTFSKNATTSTGAQATDGGFFAEQITSSNGASLFRQEADGTVHIGENSIVLADESISASGFDTIYSSSGRLQLGNNSSHTTVVEGALEIQEPTAPNHAATKNYVDTNTVSQEYLENYVNTNTVSQEYLENYVNTHTVSRKYLDTSIAMAMAMSALPRATDDKKVVAVGIGQHGSQAAIAVGVSAIVGERNTQVNLNITGANSGKVSVAAGVGWSF